MDIRPFLEEAWSDIRQTPILIQGHKGSGCSSTLTALSADIYRAPDIGGRRITLLGYAAGAKQVHSTSEWMWRLIEDIYEWSGHIMPRPDATHEHLKTAMGMSFSYAARHLHMEHGMPAGFLILLDDIERLSDLPMLPSVIASFGTYVRVVVTSDYDRKVERLMRGARVLDVICGQSLSGATCLDSGGFRNDYPADLHVNSFLSARNIDFYKESPWLLRRWMRTLPGEVWLTFAKHWSVFVSEISYTALAKEGRRVMDALRFISDNSTGNPREAAYEISEVLLGRLETSKVDQLLADDVKMLVLEMYQNYSFSSTISSREVRMIMTLRQSMLGLGALKTLDAMEFMARALESEHERGEAIEFAYSVFYQSKLQCGLRDPATLRREAYLAQLYMSLDQARLATPLYDDLYRHYGMVEGPYSLNTLTSMSNLALAMSQIGDNEAACTLLNEKLRICRELFGVANGYTLGVMVDLTDLLVKSGQLVQATSVGRECLSLKQREYGPDHDETLLEREKLAQIYRDYNDQPSAILQYEQIFYSHWRISGPRDPKTLDAWMTLLEVVAESDDQQRFVDIRRTLHTLLDAAEINISPWARIDRIKIDRLCEAMMHEENTGRTKVALHALLGSVRDAEDDFQEEDRESHAYSCDDPPF